MPRFSRGLSVALIVLETSEDSRESRDIRGHVSVCGSLKTVKPQTKEKKMYEGTDDAE